jgi:hypothetical protein
MENFSLRTKTYAGGVIHSLKTVGNGLDGPRGERVSSDIFGLLVTNNPVLHNIPEERKAHLLRVGILK